MIANTLTIILLINSFVTIGLILNQNESTKDTISRSTNIEISNPLENLTWCCILLEFILLLVKTKITEL